MASRTSFSQFAVMVDFMERNGDLSKPTGGPRGRQWCLQKWKELTIKLNSEGTGDSRTEEKWRKVWSDLKNNTKKKWAKINRSMHGTGGGPAFKTALTDLEQRVMAILGVQAATGMAVPELGFGQIEESMAEQQAVITVPPPTERSDIEVQNETYSWPLLDEDTWNTPGSSSDPTRVPPSQALQPPLRAITPPPRSTSSPTAATPPAPVTPPAPMTPPAQRRPKRKRNSVEDFFIRCETNARESERERDRMFVELERERIRQRDVELQIQTQWLEFMKEAMHVLVRFMDANK